MEATEGSHPANSRLYASAEWARYALPLPALPRPVRVRRDWLLAVALAGVAFDLTFRVASSNMHTPAGVTEGPAIRALVSAVPYAAATLAALAMVRPWLAFLGILLLTPLWDAAQVFWYVGGFEITMQTVFVVALGAGCLVSRVRGRATERAAIARASASDYGARQRLLRRLATSFTVHGVAGLALVAFLALALASTYSSPNVSQSELVLVHGIIEPIAMGLILLALRPGRRGIVLVAIVLGVSAGVGCLLDIVQTVPGVHSLALLQSRRIYFSMLTYGNVGLLGDLLAMAVPLLIGVLAARRSLRVGSLKSALLLVALAACLAGLFLTFSKSAWLATSIATVLLMLLASRTWRSRAAIALTAGLVSAVVVPWPALVLQAAPTLNGAYRTVMVQVVGQARFDSWNPATLAGEGSVVFRLRAAEAGLHMAVDHPLLGVGLDQYQRYYLSGYAIPPIDGRIDFAHSLWPELAAELGFPAMGLVILIYAAALLALWRVYRNPPDTGARLLAATLIAALLSWVIVATAFGTGFYRPSRSMASEIVTMSVATATAFALARRSSAAMVRVGGSRGRPIS